MEVERYKKIIGIIPARYNSSRFPGKPLVDIYGMTMIERVYKSVAEALDEVYVATDDKRIMDAVNDFGGSVIMTSEDHQSGTDRCFEAINKIQEFNGKVYDIVINIQGDEPFIHPGQIDKIIACFQDEETEIATLIKPIEDMNDIFDQNTVKAVIDIKSFALYFSRAPIPYLRNYDKNEWLQYHTFYKHLGIYAYKTKILEEITKKEATLLEKAESLEQNRWLENGFKIKTAITTYESISIDTKEDLKKIQKQGLKDE